jgi:rubredoxin-NAD+ reductase
MSQSENGARGLVVIGSGMAGYGLVKELRQLDAETPITIITADDGRNYPKPLLSTGFTRGVTADAIASADAGTMAAQLHCSVMTRTRVTSIDTVAQTVTAAGMAIPYSKLVLALGSEAILPAMKGDALDRVFSVNSLEEYARFRSEIEAVKAQKIAIIGGGLIGTEFTNDLINGGFETETVDPLGYCLPTLLPEVAGKTVQEALAEKGARFHFGPLQNGVFGPVVTSVNRTEHGVVVNLNNGQIIAADLVLSSVGVRARTELAKAAGIGCNRGIVTNSLLETSAPNVYALGDCAEVEGLLLFYVSPLMTCAKALAKTLAGTPTEVAYPAMPVSIKVPACPVVVAPPPKGAKGEWEIEKNGRDIVARFLDPLRNLLGFALTGEGTKMKASLQKQLPPMLGKP